MGGDVKRYSNELRHGNFNPLVEKPDGTYVLRSDYDTILTRHNALREAVAWERECNDTRLRWSNNLDASRELIRQRIMARAEVDRLIANESAADCKGEK